MKTFASVPGGCRSFGTVIVGLAVAFSSMLAQAQPITGSIGFTGGADISGTLSNETATAYTGFFNTVSIPMPVVLGGSQTGTFVGAPTGTQVTFFPFTFLPFTTSPQELWSFTAAGETYTFTATTLAEVVHPNFLNLSGLGTISIMGTINYTDTTATWSYTDTGSGPGPGYNFAASITATPEPSTTSLMTMLALIGGALRIVARRKSCLPAGVS
jgi:hypothetical protein